jgi:predicted DNA-binding transcriptional regulator AlpA
MDEVTRENRLNRFLRRSELPQYTGLRRTSLDELIKSGKFPRPVLLVDNGRAVAWLEGDVISWQQGRIALRNAADPGRSDVAAPAAAEA